MAWPFDSFDDPVTAFATNFLAARKARALDEEYRLAQLQRADYEASTQYRELKRQLDLEGTQSANTLTKLQTDNQQLALKLSEHLFQPTVDSANAGARESKARASTAESTAKITKARAGNAQTEIKLANEGASLGNNVTRQALSTAGIDQTAKTLSLAPYLSNPDFTTFDAFAMAKATASQLNVKDETGTLATMLANSIYEDSQRKRLAIDTHREEMSRARQNQLNEVVRGGQPSIMAAINSGAYSEQEVAALKKTFDQPGIFGAKYESTFDKAMSEARAKRISSLEEQILEARRRVDEAKSTYDTSYFDFSGGKKSAVTTEENNLKQLQMELQKLYSQSESSNDPATKSGSMDVDKLEEYLTTLGSAVPASISDAEISKLQRALKERGVDVSVEVIKELRQRARTNNRK